MTEQHTSRLNGLLVHGMVRFVAERGTGGRLATTVVFGPDGAGLTTTVLHDLTGPVGRAGRLLTVRPLS